MGQLTMGKFPIQKAKFLRSHSYLNLLRLNLGSSLSLSKTDFFLEEIRVFWITNNFVTGMLYYFIILIPFFVCVYIYLMFCYHVEWAQTNYLVKINVVLVYLKLTEETHTLFNFIYRTFFSSNFLFVSPINQSDKQSFCPLWLLTTIGLYIKHT